MRNKRIYRRKDTRDQSVWWATWYDSAGIRHRQSTGLTDRKAAEQWLAIREREIVSPTPSRPSKSLGDALELICMSNAITDNTKRMYTHRGTQILHTLGDIDLFKLTRDDIQKHIGLRLAKGISRNTVNKELITLRRCLNMVEAPLECLRKLEFKFTYKPRSRYLTVPEFNMLRSRLEPKRQLWLALACYTGGRRGEVAGLSWSDVDWEQRSVHIRGTKTEGSDRRVPLPDVLRDELLRYWADQKGPIVGDWGKVVRDLKAACSRAGIPAVNPTDCRRTYCSWLMQSGLSANVVRRLMGHSTTRMIDLTYGQIDWATLQGAVSKLPTFPALAPPTDEVEAVVEDLDGETDDA